MVASPPSLRFPSHTISNRSIGAGLRLGVPHKRSSNQQVSSLSPALSARSVGLSTHPPRKTVTTDVTFAILLKLPPGVFQNQTPLIPIPAALISTYSRDPRRTVSIRCLHANGDTSRVASLLSRAGFCCVILGLLLHQIDSRSHV